MSHVKVFKKVEVTSKKYWDMEWNKLIVGFLYFYEIYAKHAIIYR